MTHLSISGNRPLPFVERALLATAELWRRWRSARIRARVRRELRYYDEHLLRDMGLTRGDDDTILPSR
jgi:uncharacterized protein YjiS (DUF1127 family)